MIDHEARKKSIGASEIAAVLGCNRYMSPMDVWLVKTGREAPFTGNEHTRRGQRQEAQIIDWLREELQDENVEILTNFEPISLKDTIATATPDGIIIPFTDSLDSILNSWMYVAGIQLAQCCIVEAKSTLRRVNCVEEIDISHLMQTQWQMGVTGIPNAKLCLFGPMVSDYQCFDIRFDPELFAKMLKQATEWWERHVVGDIMPEPISADDAARLWPFDNGGVTDISEDIYRKCCRLREVKDQIKTLESEADGLSTEIKIAARDNREIQYAGVKVATCYTVVPGPPKMPKQRDPHRVLRLNL